MKESKQVKFCKIKETSNVANIGTRIPTVEDLGIGKKVACIGEEIDIDSMGPLKGDPRYEKKPPGG